MDTKCILVAAGIATLAACSTFMDPIPDGLQYAYTSQYDVPTASACVLRNAVGIAGTSSVERASSVDGTREVTLSANGGTAAVARSASSSGSTQVTVFARPADGKRFIDPLMKNCAVPQVESAPKP